MKKVAVIGHFGKGFECFDGQTIKTKILTEELTLYYGKNDVSSFDTHGGIKIMPKILVNAFSALKQHENVIILPAHNGLRIIAPWLAFLNRFMKKKLHYVVIGGWLPSILKGRQNLSRALKRFNGIYVETNTMKTELEKQGFCNIYVLPNCKKLNVLNESDIVYSEAPPYRLCIFSRIMREKGIEHAVNAVSMVNSELGSEKFLLDIYGKVDDGQTEWFEKIKSNFPNCVRYCGVVPHDKSVETLKDYFALLFPTLFYTEGIPGTIIDAFSAGVPVISSEWESWRDVLTENDSITYKFGDQADLCRKLKYCAENADVINSYRKECLKSVSKFSPDVTVKQLLSLID